MVSCVRELLSCKRELDNSAEDQYVIAVCRVDGIVVGHIPKKLSFLCAVFIKLLKGAPQSNV